MVILVPPAVLALQVVLALPVAPAPQVLQIHRATPHLQTVAVRQVLQTRPIHHHNLALTVPKKRKRRMCLTHLTMCMGLFA